MKRPAVADPRTRMVQKYNIKAAEAWALGAAVVLDATPELTECGADPLVILGFAEEPVFAGDRAGDRKGTTTGNLAGFSLGASVAIAEEGRKFWLDGDNDPVAGDVNQSYGIAVDGDGVWYVDGTDAVNQRVYVHDVDLDTKRYLVSVLAANRQVAP